MKKASKIITGFNKGEYKALIKDLYTEDARLTKQKNRYVTALKKFIELYGDEEVEIYSAPGRSEVGGNHTDHQFGKVLATSINLDAIAIVAKRDDDVIDLKSEGYERIIVSLSSFDPAKAEKGTSQALIQGVASKLKEEGYKAFYVAIGCQGGRLPGVPGEDAEGVKIAVDFLHEATENHEQVIKGNVVVIGGGNVAVDCARTAKRFNADSVTLICLEDKNSMPASNEEIEETEAEGIKVLNCWGPKEIVKDENGKVKAITLRKCLRTIDPETKKFSPVYDDKYLMTIEADEIICAIGQTIVWNDLLKDTKVTYWRGNYPIADALTYQTADEEIFVGGDVYSGPKFAIDAIEAGKNAAESLHRFVRPGASLTIGRNRRDFVMLNKDDISVGGYDLTPRQEAGMDESIDYKNSFVDAHKTLTEEQVYKEACRCLGCGVSVVDPNKCIGCGVCTTRCKFDAIHLVRDHPECSTMVKSEDKFKAILPYAAKRAMKICFGKKTPEEKESIRKHKEYKKAKKASKKETQNA